MNKRVEYLSSFTSMFYRWPSSKLISENIIGNIKNQKIEYENEVCISNLIIFSVKKYIVTIQKKIYIRINEWILIKFYK